MADTILVLNAGSSSLKFSAFDAGSDKLPLILKGQVEGL
jgi:acetate kinase